MRIGVLAVQGAVSEHLAHIERCGVEPVAVRNRESLSGVKGLIIPGGESTTIGKLIEHYSLAEQIRDRCMEGSLGLFGTCAGMVLMAQEISDGISGQPKLGLMDIRVKRNAFGRQRESFETNLPVKEFNTPLRAVFIRAPVIEEHDEAVEVLAEITEGVVAARQRNLLAVSFHPELTEDLRIHQLFIGICEKI